MSVNGLTARYGNRATLFIMCGCSILCVGFIWMSNELTFAARKRHVPVPRRSGWVRSRLHGRGHDPSVDRDRRPRSSELASIAVVVPFVSSQIHVLRLNPVLASRKELRPCDVHSQDVIPVDIVYYISSTWDHEVRALNRTAQAVVNEMLRDHPDWTRCFQKSVFLSGNLTEEEDVYVLNGTSFDFTGPNKQFKGMMKAGLIRENYRFVFVMEPDTAPVRPDWLARLWQLTLDTEAFWIKGTAYRGSNGPILASKKGNKGSNLTSTWTTMNGNAIYNTHDDSFLEFLDSVWNATDPKMPYDVAIHDFLMKSDNFGATKQALTKIRFTSFVQNRGYESYRPSEVRDGDPETFLVHSRARDGVDLKRASAQLEDMLRAHEQ